MCVCVYVYNTVFLVILISELGFVNGFLSRSRSFSVTFHDIDPMCSTHALTLTHRRAHKPPRRDQTHMHKSTANRSDTRPERQSHLNEYECEFSVHTVCVWAQ